MQLSLSITELSRLTHKSRPSLYKYLSAYQEGRHEHLPYAFLLLFQMVSDPTCPKEKIYSFCEKVFVTSNHVEGYSEVVEYLCAHEGEIDFETLLLHLKENMYARN